MSDLIVYLTAIGGGAVCAALVVRVVDARVSARLERRIQECLRDDDEGFDRYVDEALAVAHSGGRVPAPRRPVDAAQTSGR